ncbi:MAG TPA: hypothetical protein DCL44_06820 [Elusimicrobia bacterium]|nr:hypothetical protein [Elusimicrobiota bacterium]
MIKKIGICLAAGVALSLSVHAQRSAMPNTRSGEKYVAEGKYFKCVLPAGWQKLDIMGQPPQEGKVYGVDVVGRTGTEGIAPSISVKYYARHNKLFKSAEEFLRIHSKPIVGLGLAGDKYSSVTAIRLAGRPASKFERRKSTFARPRQVKNKPIPVFERYIVLPARDGFFVLNYYCAFSEAKANLPSFEGVVNSFEPLIK